jgi:hypothetical protein
VRRGLAIAVALLAAFLAVTGWALESGEVAVLETRRPEGGARRTRVWLAEADGTLWLEAATPDRDWLGDVALSPRVRLRRGAEARAYEAVAMPGAGERARVRALLRRKYGLRDRWVGLLQDTSRAVAVRLVPVASPAAPRGGET